MKFTLLLVAFILCCSATQAADIQLSSPTATLNLVRAPNHQLFVRLQTGATRFEQSAPLAIEVVEKSAATRWLYGAYNQVKTKTGVLDCRGELRSINGTRFIFRDLYTRAGDGFQLQRRVEIATPNTQDVGFSSRFSLAWTTPKTAHDCDVLMPGAWYRQNQNVPPHAFAANSDAQSLLLRGDRLGLPLVMARDTQSGITLELERVGGIPTTIAQDAGNQRLIDARIQIGALGLLNVGNLQVAFSFPGTEDERAVLGADTPPPRRFAPRSHPVEIGIAHNYTLYFEARPTASFAAAVEQTTKTALARARPPLLRADLQQVYRAEMDLLDAVIRPYNGTVSVPFQVVVPTGEIKDTSMQMGFVGMALPCAALLLRDGFLTKNQSAIERAMRVVDFWVQQAPTASGVPEKLGRFSGARPSNISQLSDAFARGFRWHAGRVASVGNRAAP